MKDSRDGVNQEFVLPDTLEKLFSTGSSQQSYYSLNARKASWGYLQHKYWLCKFMGGSLALAPFLLKQWYLGHCLWIWLPWVNPLLCPPFTWPVNNFPDGLTSHCWWRALHECPLVLPSGRGVWCSYSACTVVCVNSKMDLADSTGWSQMEASISYFALSDAVIEYF